MKNNNIFKEKLYNHTVPVREGLWDAIEAQLPGKKEDRVFPLFWFTLFASTLLGGALMFGISHNKQSNITIPANSNPVTVQNATVNLQANAEPSLASETNTAPSAITRPSTTQSAGSTSVPSLNNVNYTNSTIANFKTTTNKKQLSIKGSNQNVAIENSSLKTFDLHQATALNSTTNNSNRNSSLTSFLTPADMQVSADVLAQREISSLHPDPNCYKFSGNTDKYALSADIFGGPGFSPRSFEDTAGESSIYADARKATEHSQYGWSAGGRVNILFRNGFGARLGLTYTQVGDIFDYTDTLATQSTTRVDSFFASDGTFLYADTSRVLIFGTLIKKIHNTYRYLDIPLLASFELPLGRSIFMINAGPVFNLTSSHEGQILDPNLHPGSITPGDPGEIPVYKTSLGLSLYMGAGVVFPLTDHLSGLVEPSFLYRLKPVTLDSYPLKEHRHYASLNLGIRYHFD
ncbi:MAG: hypothetical protein KBA14_03150 [Saprospiraceae bacterium]|nr:hypothetical protein [Saprospiraceae bacterium]